MSFSEHCMGTAEKEPNGTSLDKTPVGMAVLHSLAKSCWHCPMHAQCGSVLRLLITWASPLVHRVPSCQEPSSSPLHAQSAWLLHFPQPLLLPLLGTADWGSRVWSQAPLLLFCNGLSPTEDKLTRAHHPIYPLCSQDKPAVKMCRRDYTAHEELFQDIVVKADHCLKGRCLLTQPHLCFGYYCNNWQFWFSL